MNEILQNIHIHLHNMNVDVLQTINDIKLVGFFDTDLDRSSNIKQKYNIKSYNDQADLIGLCDAIIIATPTVTHYEIAKEVLDQGRHVFIEKPITTTIYEANQLLKIADENQLFIQVGHIERFNPAFLSLKEKNINPQFI